MIEYVKRRQKSKSQTRLNMVRSILFNKYLLYSVSGILILFFLFFILPKVDNLPLFTIDKFEIIGNESLSEDEIKLTAEKFKQRSLLTLSTDEVEEHIRENNLYVEEVYVRKVLPGTLEIEVVERYPSLIAINLSGSYLLDSKFRVISILNKQDFDVTDYEVNVLLNYATIEDDFVKERYIASLSEEERAEIKWEEVEAEKKQEVLDEVKEDINTRLTSFLSDQKALIVESPFKDLNINYFLYPEEEISDRESKSYEIGEYLNRDKMSFTENTRIEFLNMGFRINEIKWVSEFRLEITFDDFKKAILTDRDSLESQIEKMQLLIINSVVETQREFDLRGIKYTSE